MTLKTKPIEEAALGVREPMPHERVCEVVGCGVANKNYDGSVVITYGRALCVAHWLAVDLEVFSHAANVARVTEWLAKKAEALRG